jgi:uncharacterized protein (DUF58 family)
MADVTSISVQSLVALQQYAKNFSLPKGNIRAANTGCYVSRFKGRGMEFSESRLYQAGDDIRTIDWRVTARTGKTHTKLFAEEKERPVLSMVDFRASMFFATRGCLKSVMAAKISALLSWRAHFSGDRMGGLVFSDSQHHELRPSRGQAGVLHWIQQLVNHNVWMQQKLNAQSKQNLQQTFVRLKKVTTPGSFIYLISDFRGLDKSAETQLTQLAQHNSVVLIFIYDPFEANLPERSILPLQYADKKILLNTAEKEVRARYKQHFIQRLDQLTALSHRLGVSLIPCQTTDNIHHLFSTPHQFAS